MNRRIIIIINSGEEGSKNYCEGVYRDKENYVAFFKNPYGGYFSDNEIRILNKPAKTAVKIQLDALTSENIEFSIIIFCGHGYYSTVSESNILCLNSTEEIDSLDFRKNYKKRIIILDSCREEHDEYLLEETRDFSATLLKAGTKTLNPVWCKHFYNEAIKICSDQLVNLFGCSVGELCGDNAQFGGYYSSSLLKSSKDWADSRSATIDLQKNYDIHAVSSCHGESISRVKRLSDNKQTPIIEKPRITNVLPFCIVA